MTDLLSDNNELYGDHFKNTTVCSFHVCTYVTIFIGILLCCTIGVSHWCRKKDIGLCLPPPPKKQQQQQQQQQTSVHNSFMLSYGLKRKHLQRAFQWYPVQPILGMVNVSRLGYIRAPCVHPLKSSPSTFAELSTLLFCNYVGSITSSSSKRDIMITVVVMY